MRYEMKIVNRADRGNEKVSRGRPHVDEVRERERAIFLPRANTQWLCTTLFLRSLSLFFFFMKASNERNFVAGYLSALTVPRYIPSLLFSPRFCREFFIQTMLKYILCTQYNIAKALPLYTRTRKN